MQQFLKAPSGLAWAGVISAQFFEQLFCPVDKPLSFFNLLFGREPLAPFAG
jgi:hypothetical protein